MTNGTALESWVKGTFSVYLEIPLRPHGAKGFVLLPKRWVVERTFAWFGRFRPLNKDYEKLSLRCAGLVYLASIRRSLTQFAPVS